MNLDPPQPGHPFEDDYSEPAYGPDQAELQEVLRQQVEGIGRPDRVWRRQIIEACNERREAAGLPVIEMVTDEDGFNVLYARGQIVTVRESWDNPAINEELNSRLFRLRPHREELPSGIIVVEHPDPPRGVEDLLDAVRYLRARNCPASLNHIVPLAQDDPPPTPSAVGKSVGPPVPAPCFGPFAEYRAGFTEPPEERKPVVGIIDVGIPEYRRADGWLADVPRVTTSPDNIDPLDAMPADGKLDEFAGHGSFVAGLVARVAPWAHIRMYKALTTDGFSTDADIAAVMLRAVADGARILNLSLGCQTTANLPPVAMARAVAQIRQQFGDDVAIIAAAGNFGDTRLVWPAALEGVVSVAGLTGRLKPTTWSTHGPWVTASTVGECLRSVYVDIGFLNPPPQDEPCMRWTGTSFAAPQIAGVVARACYELNLTPQAAVDKVLKAGAPVQDYGQALRVLPGAPY